MNNQHRRIFSHSSNAIEIQEENSKLLEKIKLRYLLLVYDFLKFKYQAEGHFEQAMNKFNSKLISDLAKRHSKLAKNVIESQDDRIKRKSRKFV